MSMTKTKIHLNVSGVTNTEYNYTPLSMIKRNTYSSQYDKNKYIYTTLEYHKNEINLNFSDHDKDETSNPPSVREKQNTCKLNSAEQN